MGVSTCFTIGAAYSRADLFLTELLSPGRGPIQAKPTQDLAAVIFDPLTDRESLRLQLPDVNGVLCADQIGSFASRDPLADAPL